MSLSGLTPGLSYTYKAYSDSGCATEIASETFSTFLSTLTASNLGVNGARLTLSDHTGDWWGKRTVPADNACTSKGTASTHDLSGLAAGTETATNANGGPRNRWD